MEVLVNILVTGAAGFIGSHLAERLIDLGHAVLGLDCFTDYYARALKELNASQIQDKGVEFLPLDLASDDLGPAIKDVEFVYHVAAQPGISATVPFETYARNNITATHRLLEAVKQSASFRGFINISTSSVYGADASGDETTEPRPTSYYGVTKLAAEQLVLAHARDRGLPACSLRLFSVYGPRERPEKLYSKLIRCIFEDEPFTLYEGSEQHLRSYTFVDDAIDGLVAAMGKFDACRGEVLNIGIDTARTTAEAISTVEEVIGRTAKIVTVPRRPGDQLKTHANIEKARQLLGYNPTTTLQEGVEQAVAWYRECIHGQIDF
jgi:nucleoside-diphosphate-sugar epimerase